MRQRKIQKEMKLKGNRKSRKQPANRAKENVYNNKKMRKMRHTDTDKE